MSYTFRLGAEGVDVAVLAQAEAVAGGHSDLVLSPRLEAGQLQRASILSSLQSLGGVTILCPITSLHRVQLHLSELPFLCPSHSQAKDPPDQSDDIRHH